MEAYLEIKGKDMHIRNRNELIEYLESHAPSKAIARALQEGRVENLGAFNQILLDFNRGFIVKVISRFKKTWYVAIYASFLEWKVQIIDTVPWNEWIGGFAANKLYQGDNPKQYEEKRNEANQTHTR